MFWDNVAWIYDLFAEGINRKADRALRDTVAELIRPGENVLECACGTGLLSGAIAPRCGSLIATDLSEKMLRRAAKNTGTGEMSPLSGPTSSSSAIGPANLTRWWRPM